MTQVLSESDLIHHYQLLEYLLRDPEITLYYFQELDLSSGVFFIIFQLKSKFPDRYIEAIDEYSFNLRLKGDLETLQRKYSLALAKRQITK